MKRTIGKILALVSVLTVGIGIGYGLNTTEPIHILEKAHVLGNTSVFNSKDSLTEDVNTIQEDTGVVQSQSDSDSSEPNQETNSSSSQNTTHVETKTTSVIHDQPTIRLNGD